MQQKVIRHRKDHINGIEEVGGSIPPGSTNKINKLNTENPIFHWSFGN